MGTQTAEMVAQINATVAGKKSKSKAKKKVVQELDFVVETANQVENLTRTEALQALPKLAIDVNANNFQLGGVLSAIQDKNWWEGEAESFQDFVNTKLDVGYRKVMYLIQIYNDLVKAGIPWSAVSDVGWAKLKEISPILTTENVAIWVEFAKKLNRRDLVKRVNAKKKGKLDTIKDVEELNQLPDPDETSRLTYNVHQEQKETIQLALERAKKEKETNFDAVALEAIAMSYLSGTTKPRITTVLKQYKPKQIIDAFVKIFPEWDITAKGPKEEIEEDTGDED